MKKSHFTVEQIAFSLRQVKYGSSGEYLIRLVMTPPFQVMESPAIPERFNYRLWKNLLRTSQQGRFHIVLPDLEGIYQQAASLWH